MAFDPGTLAGVVATSSAITLALVKVIDRLSRKIPQPAQDRCHAVECKAPMVYGQLRDYHLENRDILRDIRDGITILVGRKP